MKGTTPRHLAYLLRQAFDISSKVDNEYKALKDNWKVTEEVDSVLCVRKSRLVVENEEVAEIVMEEELIDVALPVPSVMRIEDAIGACLEHKGKSLVFPNFKPNANELAVLERWGSVAGNVVFHYTDNILTARKKG